MKRLLTGRGYLLGPLILLPLLGALFLLPQPRDRGAYSFTTARASLLQCHVQAGDLFALTPDDAIAPPASMGAGRGARDIN